MKFGPDKNAQTASFWERLGVASKESVAYRLTKIFSLIHYILEIQICSSIFFCIFLFIETVQLFYYSIHPSIPNMFNTRYLEFLQIAVRYFHVTNG